MTNTNKNTAESGAETKKYLVIPYDSGPDARNDWHKHCQEAGIPCITVTRTGRAKYAHVECDCSTLPAAKLEIMQTKSDELEAEYKSLFQSYRDMDSYVIPSLESPSFGDIHMNVAEDLAFELFMLLRTRLETRSMPYD
jgi:hypothetical protein